MKKNEILQRQTHHLVSQLFHMINLHAGSGRRIAELERVVDDKLFLADHAPSEESLELPMDMSPSIRRKLIHLEQLKAILHRRNDLIGEMERQIDLQLANKERQDDLIKEQKEAIEELRGDVEERNESIAKLQDQVSMLTEVVNRWWNNPFYKMLARVKRLVTGGGKA